MALPSMPPGWWPVNAAYDSTVHARISNRMPHLADACKRNGGFPINEVPHWNQPLSRQLYRTIRRSVLGE